MFTIFSLIKTRARTVKLSQITDTLVKHLKLVKQDKITKNIIND
jgi:hypothetical protein